MILPCYVVMCASDHWSVQRVRILCSLSMCRVGKDAKRKLWETCTAGKVTRGCYFCITLLHPCACAGTRIGAAPRQQMLWHAVLLAAHTSCRHGPPISVSTALADALRALESKCCMMCRTSRSRPRRRHAQLAALALAPTPSCSRWSVFRYRLAAEASGTLMSLQRID
jgi:hypothetical protein